MFITSLFLSLLQLAAAAPVDKDFLATRQVADGSRNATSALASAGYLVTVQAPSVNMLYAKLELVLEKAIEYTQESWEYGAMYQALLENYNPELTPFGWNLTTTKADVRMLSATPSGKRPYDLLSSYNFPSELQQSTAPTASFLSSSPTPAIRAQSLWSGGSALGDSAAFGQAIWLLSMLGGKPGVPQSPQSYAWAAANELAFLNNGPKDNNGLISHRGEEFQLWSDQGYMISPFIAFLGLATNNTALLRQALQQWQLTSNALIQDNLYQHVIGGSWTDNRLWATGNGWMLGGAVRVLASIKAANATAELQDGVNTAMNTLAAVFKESFAQLTSDNLIPNAMKSGDDTADTAGTAMIVAAYYRFHALNQTMAAPLLAAAGKTYDAVVNQVDVTGHVNGCVDPTGANGFMVVDGVHSPEGQSFVALMYAARKDAGV